MKKCPYCFAEIDPAARKCQHCGEWVSAPPKQATTGISKAELDESLKTVNFIAQWKIIGAVISIPIALIMLIAFANSASVSKRNSRPKTFGDTMAYPIIRDSQLAELPNAVKKFIEDNHREPSNLDELKAYILKNNIALKSSDLDSMSLISSPDGTLGLNFNK
ncbi:MAG: zinc ribbon domain-containing protein [Pontiellaceae bacterium]|nr:zinc ribbon domain-containing protein [Pontiellaceae bacterium]